ncbi:MAG: MMPL family transporter, partial [Candidatus Omnitrophica bacterium]|nr:MMPL family transporter [Candidatus Omnitrophota bacterium]
MFRKLVKFSVSRPKAVMVIVGAAVLLSLLQFPRMKVDTDPENMLSDTETVRVFHKSVKREFALYDMVVLGITNDLSENGVFSPDTLENVYRITEGIKGIDGVISYELMSPSTKDDIEQAGPGTVSFKWLMSEPPYTQADALKIKERAMANPLFFNTIVSQDGKALCIYVPIKSKDMSYRISKEIMRVVAEQGGKENYYVTGLPVANDTFGVEMFVQMAISAPLAMFLIFILMLVFFKKVSLVLSPLILAGITVVITMGLLIGMGYTVHIMSSMIPIFLMPIAVLDSVHILSDFHEKYRKSHDRKKAIIMTVEELFVPMLFTSLTTFAGFFSLSFAEIPPVQVFGVFVALGVALAWILTITFIPASISLMSKKSFENFGASKEDDESGLMNAFLRWLFRISVYKWKVVLTATALLVMISGYGISRIVINDNPVKWFTPGHRIRVADRVLNSHFGGTYTAYLVLEAEDISGEVFQKPEMLEYISRMQGYLDENGIVGKTTSVADVVKKVYMELMGGEKEFYRIPSTEPAVAQSLLSFQNSHKPDDLWHFIAPDNSKANIWFQLTSGDNRNMTSVEKEVSGYMVKNPPPYPVKADWAGLTYINVVWQNKMVTGMLRNFAGSFIIVLFMMIFLFRSPIRGIVSMLPLTVTIVFIYSLLGFFGKDYDMPVAVLSALTLGLSVDFAIHFIQRAREIY